MLFQSCVHHRFVSRLLGGSASQGVLFSLFLLVAAGCSNDRVNFESLNSTSGVQADVFINDNAEFTNQEKVRLTLAATSAEEMYVTNDPSCESGGEWEAYSVSKEDWSLEQANEKAQVFVAFRDAEGTVFGCASDDIVHDDIPPQMNWVDSQLPTVSNLLEIDFAFEASDAGSGVAKIECDKDAEGAAGCESPWQLSSLSEGGHQAIIRAVDRAGNVSVDLSHAWRVDQTLPMVEITQGPNNPDNQTSASVAFVGNDGSMGAISEYLCVLDSGQYQACTSPVQLNGLSDGSHIFYVMARDEAGNLSAPDSHMWVVDTVIPTVKIDAAPNSPANSTAASFSFSGADVGVGLARFECSLDSSAYVPCASPQNYADLASGSHSFSVRSVDLAGNLSVVASHSWMIDVAAPTVVINAMPSNPSASKTASFSFTVNDVGSGVAATYCKLDSGAPVACASPVNYADLADGPRQFSVYAVDVAGNQSNVASYAWSIDTVLPTVKIDEAPNSISGSAAASFYFSGADVGVGLARFECSLDGSAYVTCSSPQNYADLAAGSHSFSVRSVDLAGNVSSVASHSWMIDLAAPTMVINEMPSDPSASSSAIFAFNAEDVGSGVVAAYCSLDGAAPAVCTSPVTYADLADGPHQFSVYAVDGAGNSSNVASHSWTIDTVIPTVTIDAAPNNPTNVDIADFVFSGMDSGTGVASYECSLNGGSFVTCSSPLSYSGLGAGNQSLSVRATDFAGNVSALASHSWMIDLAAPVVAITSAPANPSALNSATFAFSATDVGSGVVAAYCSLDGGTPTLCESAISYEDLADGNHLFSIYAVDNAGNNSEVVSYSWMVDTVAPVIELATVPELISSEAMALFDYQVIEDGSGLNEYGCLLDSAVYACADLGTVMINGLADGSHTLRIWATDNAGNMGFVDYTWEVKTYNPQCYDKQVIQPAAQITKKVDILFAIDTSSSFDSEKTQVISEMQSLIGSLPADTDYRVAVLLGHINTSHSGRLYAKSGSPRVLDSQELSLEDIQYYLSQMMANSAPEESLSDGGEAVIYSMSRLLEGDRLQGAKDEGFFRDDAALAVIFMGDENDICARVPAGVTLPRDRQNKEIPAFNNYCVDPEVSEATVYAQLTAVQGENPLLVSAIVYTDEDTVPSGGENSLGYGYFDIVAMNDGILIDLAAGSYAAGLSAIGELTTERLNLITRIPLDYDNVDPDSIVVKIDGLVSTDFTYNASANEINLGEAGEAMSVIDIFYCQIGYEPVE